MHRGVAVWPAIVTIALLATLVAATGLPGVLYAAIYGAAIAPGIVLGHRLVGNAKPVGWIVGSVLGYGCTQLALWLPMTLHVPSRAAFATSWLVASGLLLALARRIRVPVLTLPEWTAADTRALSLVVLLVPLLMVAPYRHLGASDAAGTRYYRAYFIADFVWHTALTAELGRYDMPPKNPYLVRRDLNYYWTYFLLPAVVAHDGPAPLDDVQRALKANAVLSAALMVGMLYLVVRAAVPSAGIAALAVTLGVLAASADGIYEVQRLWRRGLPIALVKDMNIDAIAAWRFGGLRIDNIPRSLWYTPQHAFSCALGLIAVFAASVSGARATRGAIWLSGVALGLSTCFNPLLGGMFSIVYAAGVTLDGLRGRHLVGTILSHAQAAIPVVLAISWGALNRVADGAGAAVNIGLQNYTPNNTVFALLVSAGPLLVPALLGLWPWRGLSTQPAKVAASGVVATLLLMHLVVLSDESWVGFRAGQILLLMLPVLVARALWAVRTRSVVAAGALGASIAIVGLPTTIIDTYNAQDITNRRQGPGFHWTVAITAHQSAAFAWIRANVPERATVQMEPVARGREYWSLIPSFAERRMTAGLPISLLPLPEYERASAEVKRIYRTDNAREAWELARGRGIQFMYVDGIDRAEYPAGMAKFATEPYFEGVYGNEEVTIYKVR
jgi:hypothetical protein